MVVAVVVKIEDAVNFAFGADVNILVIGDALAERLTRVLLHLNVVKLPAK